MVHTELTLRPDNLLSFAEGIDKTPSSLSKVMPFVLEASWATGRWQIMEKYLRSYTEGDVTDIFNIGIADALLCLKEGDGERFQELLQAMRDKVAGSMTLTATSSFRTCHDVMLKCHVLEDLEMIANAEPVEGEGHAPLVKALERRLEVLGAYVSDKQYLLGVRRATMELMRYVSCLIPELIELVSDNSLGRNSETKRYLHHGLPPLAWPGNPVRLISLSTQCYARSSLVIVLQL